MKTLIALVLTILGFLAFSGDTMAFATAMLIAGIVLPVLIAFWILAAAFGDDEKKSP